MVLTDLEVAGVLIDAPLTLRFDLAVPDLIAAYGEREKHDAHELEKYEFTVIALDGEEVGQVMSYLDQYRQLTMHEAWALYLCASRGYGLLTRSPQLDKAAGEANIRTHTTLWLLDQMVVTGCVSPWEATTAVRRMQERGRDLDPARCDRFLTKWDRPK